MQQLFSAALNLRKSSGSVGSAGGSETAIASSGGRRLKQFNNDVIKRIIAGAVAIH
ncbi:hypothetical protein ACNKHK_08280 [Shigella flexneri]